MDSSEFRKTEPKDFTQEMDTSECRKTDSTNNLTTDLDSSEDVACGIIGLRPTFLNKFRNILTFSIICGVMGIVSSLLSYFESQIPHLEKQFGLKSGEIGLIIGWGSIGNLVFHLFGSSMAQLVHIPHFLFWAMLIYSVAGIGLSFPYFIVASLGQFSPHERGHIDPKLNTSYNMPYSSIQKEFYFCETQNISGIECSIEQPGDDTTGNVDQRFKTMAVVVFSICLVIMGFTSAAGIPFKTVFIDDNINKRKTGFYLGFVIGLSIFGPGIAFVIGGVTSKVYVTLQDVDFTVNDPRWIGAWWLGFIVFSIATAVSVFPMLCFPRRLKPRTKDETEKLKKPEHVLLSRMERIKERALSYKRVLTSPVYVALIVINCSIGFPWSGYWSFLSKYITTQFGTPLWKANMILAVSNIVSLCAGCFVGGIVTLKIKMTPRNCLLVNVIFTSASIALFCFGLITGCDQPNIYGPNTSYDAGLNTTTPCISECECNPDKFFPICGSNGINYHSPCYAGCPASSGENTTFSNCTCIPDGDATAGLCPYDCSNMYPWAVVNFLCFFTDALTWMPMLSVWLRSVEDRDKSTAIGLHIIIGTLISSMPGPIAFGKIIDTTCLIWESTCSSEGACQLYDIVDLRVKLHAVTIAIIIVACLGLVIMLRKVWNVGAWEDLQHKRTDSVKSTTEAEMKDFTRLAKDYV